MQLEGRQALLKTMAATHGRLDDVDRIPIRLPSISVSNSFSTQEKLLHSETETQSLHSFKSRDIRSIRASMSQASLQSSPAAMVNTPQRSEKKSSLLGLFSTKEPSSKALQQYQEQIKKQQASGGSKRSMAVGMPMISSARLPSDVPKVNSKWDGMPKLSKRHGHNYRSASKSSFGSGTTSSRSSVFSMDYRLRTPLPDSGATSPSLASDGLKVELHKPVVSSSSTSIAEHRSEQSSRATATSDYESRYENPLLTILNSSPSTVAGNNSKEEGINATNILADMCSGYNQKHTARAYQQEINPAALLRLNAETASDEGYLEESVTETQEPKRRGGLLTKFKSKTSTGPRK